MGTKLITISDLHISAQALDDFDPEIESKFVAFLAELASRRDAVELVINGDFLDFVQAPPAEGTALEGISSAEGQPLCFTESQSGEKLEAICKAHPLVFISLSGFLSAKSDNQVTLLPGNHDADLFWPVVQTGLRERLGTRVADRLRVHLERAYKPALFPGLWIEHGHQFDKINSFFLGQLECWSVKKPPILRDQSGRARLIECLGTRFLVRFLNRLDNDYPYVDNVKPFSVFVRLFAASALVSGFASLRVAITMWRLLYFLGQTGISRPSDLLSADEGPIDVNSAMTNRLRALNEDSRSLQAVVHKLGFNPNLPLSLMLDDPQKAEELMVFLSDHSDLLDELDRDDSGFLSADGDEGTLSLTRGFRINESKELMRGAGAILDQEGAKLVIMGHTHEPLDRPGGMPYLNTGSWTRYYQHTHQDQFKLRPWSVLKAAAKNEFPYALKYVEIEPDAVEQAQLRDYR